MKKLKFLVASVAGSLTFSMAASAADFLIWVDDAHKLLGKPDVRFVDGDSPKKFKEGHIPGSVNAFAHDLHYLEDIRKCDGLPMCPDRAAEFIGKVLGIDNNTTVIAYDDGRGPNASGVWFFLSLYGVKDVKMMDGGFATWESKGYEVEKGEGKKPSPKTFKVNVNRDMIATKEEVLKAVEDIKKNGKNSQYFILDARRFAEYTGKKLLDALEKPGKHITVARGGHIPGAVFFEWKKVAGNSKGKPGKHLFKPLKKLKKAFYKKLGKKGLTPDKTVITYCHVGLGRGSFIYAALKLVGHKKAKVYVGSWDEWGNTPELPVEK
ncbi:MAG TPA: sulfurtransferase [Persephonella sp.]|uniref:Rhodanese domain protein n=1 Tax=Persephonella marina (strain DSM 14350 / EX-H1) TaxID=123214 RepID=C0QUS7_PERMH|nr:MULTISPECIES: rhodanese-like domain-containing protein [Persephonella]ACO04067.1 rhodanese domain protein [Persephonella marina EX-H1]HCB69942.1 sulfurtransferase [Persephonella sp.]